MNPFFVIFYTIILVFIATTISFTVNVSKEKYIPMRKKDDKSEKHKAV